MKGKRMYKKRERGGGEESGKEAREGWREYK